MAHTSAPAVLIFGATGKVGSALIRELLPDHRSGRLKLIAAIRRPDAAAPFHGNGIETRLIDLDVPELAGLAPLVDAMRGADRVFLVNGYDVKMLAQAKAVVDGARAVGAAHLVHLGVHARPDTTSVHFGWHQLVEAYIERSGLGYTHLHPSAFMQNLPLFLGLGDGRPHQLPHWVGDARLGWIDADDIGAVAAAVLRDPSAHAAQTYPLAAEQASMADIAALLSQVTGTPWRPAAREPDEFYEKITAAGADPFYMACVRNVFTRTRNGSLPESSEVFDNVPGLTGRQPTSLRVFLERNRDAFTAAAR